MTSDRDHSMMFSGYLLALRRCLNCKRSSSRVISRPCYCLTFLDTIFYVWSVARGKVCKLKKVSVSERKRKENVIYTTFPFFMLSFALLD